MNKIILSMILVGMLVLVGCINEPVICPEEKVCNICEICEEVPEEEALITSVFGEWGENELNNNELLFYTIVYNYGNVEAKNVVVTCTVDDAQGKRIYTKKKSIGNIASLSENIKEIVLSKGSINIYDDEVRGGCHVSACDNCEILDYKIPELKERLS